MARVVPVTAQATALSARAGPETPVAVHDDPPTFDEVYAAHYGDLTIQLYAYFGDRQEAQDVVQEAFCRAYSRWRTVSRYDDPVAWIRRVAWNLAVSRWRRTRTALTFLRRQRRDEPRLDGPGPDRVALLAALATLPETQRRAVVLHYLADLSIAEIAGREGVAEGTVKSWLHRGRAALAAQLGADPAEAHRG
jgi:RNA polymerase sigma-70 factor (ECF subfamily)